MDLEVVNSVVGIFWKIGLRWPYSSFRQVCSPACTLDLKVVSFLRRKASFKWSWVLRCCLCAMRFLSPCQYTRFADLKWFSWVILLIFRAISCKHSLIQCSWQLKCLYLEALWVEEDSFHFYNTLWLLLKRLKQKKKLDLRYRQARDRRYRCLEESCLGFDRYLTFLKWLLRNFKECHRQILSAIF